MFYSLENAPYWLRIAAYINPATYMTDVMRVGLIGGVFDHWMLMEVLILFLFSLISLIITTISVRRIRV
jgi:ABC-type multidrug transport system permease subunit